MNRSNELSKNQLLVSGKAKSVYATEDPKLRILSFRDDTSAFNGEKHQPLEGKGAINSQFNAFVMQHLQSQGIATHFVQQISKNDTLVRALTMLPVECVIRNRAAGGLCKRLGIEEGKVLMPPTYELFLKDDALGDPMINESLAVTLEYATSEQLQQMRGLTHRINDILSSFFTQAGMILVDYKLEFGLFEGELTLGDEFSPDGCRIWDAKTLEKMDKDRFRQDLGQVTDFYKMVGERLGITFLP